MSSLKIVRDIEYVPGSNKRAHLLDLYLPQTVTAPLAVIVWLHGGSWLYYDKGNCPGEDYLPAGFAIVSLNYSYSSEAIFPAQIHDCQAAVRWIRAHAQEYSFDTDRIGVWGVSAGAYLGSFLGTVGDTTPFAQPHSNHAGHSTHVHAVSSWAGPSNLATIGPQHGLAEHEYSSKMPYVNGLLGGDLSPESLRNASPITYVSRQTPPFQLIHGRNDDLVPLHQSQELHDALVRCGVSSTLIIDEHAGHDLMKPQHIIETMEFFSRVFQ